MPIGLGAPNTAQRDPFYKLQQFQQDPTFDWTKTPVIGGPSGYLEQNQDAVYNRALTQHGIGQSDVSRYAEWLRRQFAETQLGFKSALAEDPTLTYQKYIESLFGRQTPTGMNVLRAAFNRLSPQQRGLNPSRFGGPVRTISDI